MSRFDWQFAGVLMLGLGLSGCAEQGEMSDERGGSGPVAPGGSDAASMAGAPGGNTQPGGMAGGSPGAAGASGGAGATGQAPGGNAGMAGAPAGTSSDPRPAGGNAGTGGTAGTGSSTGAGAGGTTDTGGGAGAGDIAGMASEPPMPMPDYAPSPDNPAECPSVAPENPVGDCLGLPIYLTCEYGDDTYWYVCTCDWYHWLCAGT